MFRLNNTKERQEPVSASGGTPQQAADTTAIDRRIAEIEEQRIAFSRQNPDFDMKKEMENPTFVNYVWGNNLSVEDAYYLTHRNDTVAKAAPIRKPRITENGASKNRPAITRKNPAELSDAEIDSIIQRVKNGEHISF